LIANRHQRRDREAAARRVAAQDDAARREAAGQQPFVRRDGIVQRGRKGILGRQPVVEQERAGAGRPRDRGGEMTV